LDSNSSSNFNSIAIGFYGDKINPQTA